MGNRFQTTLEPIRFHVNCFTFNAAVGGPQVGKVGKHCSSLSFM